MVRNIASFLRNNKGLFFIVGVYIGIKFLFSTFIPFWDGGVYYYACLAPAVRLSFNLSNFNCFGHPSFIYILLIAVFQFISPGNIYLLHFPITLLGILSIITFYKIIEHLFPTKSMQIEKYLVTAIFALYPVLLASSLNFNLDYGTFVFYIFFLALLLYKKWYWVVICGLFLIFTKEPAVPMYGASIFVYWLLYRKEKNMNRTFLFLLIPIAVYGLYLAAVRVLLHTSPLWAKFGMSRAAEILFIPDIVNPLLREYLASIFLFNFNWIFTGAIFIVTLSLLTTQKRALFKHKSVLFLALTFLINTYILTSFKTFVNLRYYLPLYMYLLIFFFLSVVFHFKSSVVRKILLSAVLMLIIITNVCSIDPVTQFLFGTFQFGKHTMYKVGEFPDGIHFGVDGLVYNLQFTASHYILNKIYADTQPKTDTVFVFYDDVGDWNLTERIDKNTSKKTISFDSSFKVKSYSIAKALKLSPKPSLINYIDLPTIHVNVTKTVLNRLYDITGVKSYDFFGYSFTVYSMKLKTSY